MTHTNEDLVRIISETGDERAYEQLFRNLAPITLHEAEMYRGVDPALLPANESLETTIERVVPYFEEVIKKDMLAGKRVIIAAHGNSLRALVKYFDNISDEDIIGVNIPTGVPLVYTFDDNFNVIGHEYLGNQDEIAAKQQAVANQGKK